MKKKILILCLTITSALVLSSCSFSKGILKITNGQVANDLKTGIEARWKLNDETGDQEQSLQDYATQMQKFISAEKKQVGKYESKDLVFEDKNTQKLIQQYNHVLDQQYKLFNTFTETPTKSDYNYYVYNSQRVSILKSMVKHLSVTFDKKYEKDYDKLVKENGYCDKGATLIDDTYKVEKIELKPSEYDYRTYKVKIKNLTNTDYDLVSINIRFYDKDGTVIEDQQLSYFNLKAYQSMWQESSFAIKDKITRMEIISYGTSNRGSSGAYYEGYESDVPFTSLIYKEF